MIRSSVIGERIRDKFAASRKRGNWMGGWAPLGYEVNDSYLSRILRQTLLAPDIIEAILTGRQASTLQLDELLKPLPAAWGQQRATMRVPQ